MLYLQRRGSSSPLFFGEKKMKGVAVLVVIVGLVAFAFLSKPVWNAFAPAKTVERTLPPPSDEKPPSSKPDVVLGKVEKPLDELKPDLKPMPVEPKPVEEPPPLQAVTAPPKHVKSELRALFLAGNAARRVENTCPNGTVHSPVEPLEWNDKLAEAARLHTLDQCRPVSDWIRGPCAHQGSDGSWPGDRVSRAGYSWSTVGENLAYTGGTKRTAERIVEGWLGSPGHCENVMREKYTEVGYAIRSWKPRHYMYVAVYADAMGALRAFVSSGAGVVHRPGVMVIR